MRIAILPVENLSGRKAPLEEIRRSLADHVRTLGVQVLDEAATEAYIVRHRIRYTGGVSEAEARTFRNEEGVEAVLIASLELYDDESPPKIGLIARLVSCGDSPTILWMDSVDITGADSPGILALGLIDDPVQLRDKAFAALAGSLNGFFEAKTAAPVPQAAGNRRPETPVTGFGPGGSITVQGERMRGRFGPKIQYDSLFIEPGRRYSVALVPFFNRSDRRDAAEILLLHLASEFVRKPNFSVVEPGVVRQQLLNSRVVMIEGISLSDSDLVSHLLNADLVITGDVMDYQESSGSSGSPMVDFSVMAIDKNSKKVTWSSKSYNKGTDGVLFFDIGKVNTAGELASEMSRKVVEGLLSSEVVHEGKE